MGNKDGCCKTIGDGCAGKVSDGIGEMKKKGKFKTEKLMTVIAGGTFGDGHV
jgi:hypothetical protein